MYIPYYPISYEKILGGEDIPCYSIFDIEIFGEPSIYGFTNYHVIDQPRYEDSRVLTELDHERPNRNTRPIHLYNREQRFKSTLRTLLGGCRDPIPQEILTCFHNGDVDWHKDRVWNSVRNILKRKRTVTLILDDEHKKISTKKFYNRIPEILDYHIYPHRIKVPMTIDYEEIYRDFKRMHHQFDLENLARKRHSRIHKQAQKDCPECKERAYFPNLRYIVLRMLQDRGVEFEYKIPLLRTKRKLPVLDKVWISLKEKYHST